MPRSKSKRRRYQPPAKAKPPPSPRWVPTLFFVFLGIGFLSMLSRYILSSIMPVFDTDWFIYGGLGLVAGAFGVATQWR